MQCQIGLSLVVWHVYSNSVEFVTGGMIACGERDRIFDTFVDRGKIALNPGAQVEVGCYLFRAGDVRHRDRVGTVVDTGIVVELVEGCDVDQVTVSFHLRASSGRTCNRRRGCGLIHNGTTSVGVDERHPGGASGVVVLAVTELNLDAVAVAPFCVEPPVVAGIGRGSYRVLGSGDQC